MRIEVDIDGNITEHEDAPIIEQSENEILAQRINELQAYLNSTDFYYPRFLETGESVPEEVVLKRTEAREFIKLNKVAV